MKKKILFVLISAMLLSGCNTAEQVENTTTSAALTTPDTTETSDTTISETSETTEASTTSVTEITETEVTAKISSLMELSPSDYPVDEFVVNDKDGRQMFSKSISLSDALTPVSDNSLEIGSKNWILTRSSSTEMFRKSDNLFQDVIDSQKYTVAENYSGAYAINWKRPVLYFSEISDSNMTLESAEFSYSVQDNFKVNAFIRSDGENAEIIIDPAYMYNLPMLTSLPSELTFDINGTTVEADTLSAHCTYGENVEKLANEKYVYAELSLSDFSCTYNTKTGFNNTAVIDEIKILSEDTEKAINIPMFFTDDEKDPQMAEVYNAVVNSFDTIYTDETFGIRLIDMDFDGKPEVLVAKVALDEQDGFGFNSKVDVDIYRVNDGKLKYIDALYNRHYITDMYSNILGLVQLENGEKGWYGISYKNRDGVDCGERNTDYFYTLNGDALEYKELYREELVDAETNEYGYYIMGEKIVPEIGYEPDPMDETVMMETYAWKEYSSWFSLYEIAAEARHDFCENIEFTYTLYSDWLLADSSSFSPKKISVSKRTAAYKIAYDVDKYYLGEYNNESQDYSYWFMGAYAKPVIYLYPEEETDVSVQVDFRGKGVLTCTYPEYDNGWNVTAMPDGTLFDSDGNEYYCLYWEGEGEYRLDLSEGFCVKGEDTAKFLREKLMYMGLTAREANEFIIYWLPIMQENPYNIITFHTDNYANAVPLTVLPAPDSAIRVFMTFRASENESAIAPQTLPQYERNGFTVVEWGGGEIK